MNYWKIANIELTTTVQVLLNYLKEIVAGSHSTTRVTDLSQLDNVAILSLQLL